MASPSTLTLQRLCCLDRSSRDFPGQIDKILHSGDYHTLVLNLQGNDLRSLVDFLDEVRPKRTSFLAPAHFHVGFSSPRSSRCCFREMQIGTRGNMQFYVRASELMHPFVARSTRQP